MAKKWVITGWAGGVLLVASAAANIYLANLAGCINLCGTKADAAVESGQKETKKSTYQAALPASPILFNDIKWEYDNVVISFDSADNLKIATLQTFPAVRTECRISGRKIYVSGDFVRGQKYRFTVSKGAESFSGNKLEHDVVAELEIPDAPTECRFVSSGSYLPLHGDKLVLPYRTVNCREIQVVMRKVFENNINFYQLDSYNSDIRMHEVANKIVKLDTPKNKEMFHELDLESLLGGRKPGIYSVSINSSTQYVSITDLAIQVAEDSNSGKKVVFVRSLATGKPVVGADIAVLSYKNQLAASGKSGKDGAAVLSYDPAWAKESDYTTAIVVRYAGDIAYFDINGRITDGANFSASPQAFVFMERGVVRPGETFTTSLFLRQAKNGDPKPIPGAIGTLELITPFGETMSRTGITCDQYGFARADFQLPETAANGVYSVVCKVFGSQNGCGNGFIRVANYVPDIIKVSGRALPFQAASSENSSSIDAVQEFEFDAKYYFGTPVENGSYSYSVASSPGEKPAHWGKSWTAGANWKFDSARKFSGQGKDPDGKVYISYPGFTAQGGKAFGPVLLTASVDVAVPGGRSVTGRAVKTVFPTPFFIGLREGKVSDIYKNIEYTLLPAEKCDTVEISEPLEIKVSLTRKEWEYALVEQHGKWTREWVEREIPMPDHARRIIVPVGKFTAGKAYDLSWRLPAGEYKMTAVSGEKLYTELTFFCSAGSGGVRSADPKMLYFRTDAQKVTPGSEISFEFDAPGEGEAFLVYGEKALTGYRIIPVKSGSNRAAVKIPADIHSSSFFIGCTVIAKHNNSWMRNFGILEVNVDQSRRHKLEVAINHPQIVIPGETMPISLELKNSSGQPQSGAVCLYAVDAGVTSLTAYTVPDIYNYFYGKEVCPLTFSDMYGLLFEDLKITPDGRIGGDKALKVNALARRKLASLKQKESVRLIAPLVQIPASGKKVVTVKMPEHTGAMKIFAVASNEDSVGSAESEVVMRRPVTVTISAPRYMAPGDEAFMAVTVFNHSDKTADFACTVKMPEMVDIIGKTGFTGKNLPAGKSRTQMIKIRAKERFACGRIAVSLKSGAFSVADEKFITVRSTNAPQGFSKITALGAGESLKNTFKNDFIGETAAFLRLSASPALAVKDALDWLNNYPYGCLEQTAAAAFPFVMLDSMVKSGLIDEARAVTNRHKAAAAYAEILQMSLADGSFAMWPGALYSWDGATLFALHFIFEAEKQQMITISPEMRKKYLSYLRLKSGDADPRNRAERGYAVYILATAGDRAFLAAARNVIERTETPDFALFLAGSALIKGGFANHGIQAVKDALAAKCYLESGAPSDYVDDVSRLGMVLFLLMDCGVPDEKLADHLALEIADKLRGDNNVWGTTHANCWAVLGLSAYAAKFPPSEVQVEVIRAGKKELLTVGSPIEIPADEGVEIINRSQGKLIVQSRVSGIPRQAPPAGGVFKVVKEYLNEKGEKITSANHGDRVFVRLKISSPTEIESIVICDLLPAGLEIEDELLATRAANLPSELAAKYGNLYLKRLEKRDDRFLAFGNISHGSGEIVFQTRAVTRGTFAIPPLHAEAMYQVDVNGISGNMGNFVIK